MYKSFFVKQTAKQFFTNDWKPIYSPWNLKFILIVFNGRKKSSGCISAAAQIDLIVFLIKFNLVMNFHIKRLKTQVIFYAITVTEVLISIYQQALLIEGQICQAFNSLFNW